ncbi:MAG: FecR domain-containing protein [Myxococcales bacterium]|nr:FecR domain-containing protein [Myxococcales bacterium]
MRHPCEVPPTKLAELALDGEGAPGSLRAHVDECPTCRAQLEHFRRVRTLLREAEPPPQPEAQRRSGIEQAIRQARRIAGAGRPDRRRTWAWTLALGGTLAAAFAAAVFLLRPATPTPTSGWATLELGEVGAGQATQRAGEPLVTFELEVPAGAEAALRLTDGSKVRAQGGSRFRRKGNGFSLAAGRLDLEVRPQPASQPFLVETAQARVKVVGTRFAVAAETDATSVSVSEGVVEVTSALDGSIRRLRQGDSWKVEKTEPQAEARVAAPPAPEAPKKSHSVRAVEIRQRLQAGKVEEALRLLLKAASLRDVSAAERAELAVVEAEALLAQSRYPEAIAAYLRVCRRFAGSPQAEEALFAAASLAVDRPDAGHRAPELLEKYRAEHPSGQYRAQVEQLLRALGGERR